MKATQLQLRALQAHFNVVRNTKPVEPQALKNAKGLVYAVKRSMKEKKG